MKKKLLILLLMVGFLGLHAQQTLPAGQNYYDDTNTGIIYNKELSFDFKLVTPRSFAFGVNIGTIKAYNLTRFYNFEFGDLRHPQEIRQNLDRQPFNSSRVSRSVVFGKQNSVFVLRGGIGEKRYFSEKARTRGVGVGVSYQVGADLGLIKPYYVELIRFRFSEPNPTTPEPFISPERYSAENDDIFLNLDLINGAAPFSQGLSELSIQPGLHAKFAAHFDWGAFDENVKALEAGIVMDAFLKDIPIMVDSPNAPHLSNQQIFFNFYLALQLGKRR